MFNISKQDSTAIKGLLTVLIIIGHNHIVAPQNSLLMTYLYTFHVTCFFILPWLYNNKKEFNFKNISDIFIRNIIPYIFFFLFSITIFMVLRNKHPNISGIVIAFITGSQKLLKENTGFLFLWFLPTFCSFSILKLATDNYRWIKYLTIILSLLTFFMPWEETEWLKNNLPLGIFVTIRLFIYGTITTFLLRWREWTKYIGAVCFVYLSVLYLTSGINRYEILFMPLAGFLFILSLLPIIRMKWLKIIGKYSLPIYLTHVYIYNAIELITPHRIQGGIMSLILTIIISYITSLTFFKIEVIRKSVFPRNVKEWQEVLKA